MIRILHYIGGLGFGGSQAFVMELYRAIDRNRIQFDFVVFPDQKDKVFYSEILAMGGRVFECPRFSMKDSLRFARWWYQLLREHPEYKVIHGHVRSSASVYTYVAHKCGRKVIVHSHSTSNGSGITAAVKKIMQYPIRYQADYLFSCSDKAGRWLFGTKALQQEKYQMVPNCICCKRFFFSMDQRRRIRNKYSISDSSLVIGHIGRFMQAKNHHFLLDIFAEIHQKYDNAILLLVGDGEMHSAIVDHCRELGLEDSVIFTGSQSDTPAFYSAMDVFVFPSLWEGLPVSVVEAQTSGLPCVISDVITNDVVLTDLVEKKALTEDATEWANVIMRKGQLTSRCLDAEKMNQLRVFDSNSVADSLTVFYGEAYSGGKVHE